MVMQWCFNVKGHSTYLVYKQLICVYIEKEHIYIIPILSEFQEGLEGVKR